MTEGNLCIFWSLFGPFYLYFDYTGLTRLKKATGGAPVAFLNFLDQKNQVFFCQTHIFYSTLAKNGGHDDDSH